MWSLVENRILLQFSCPSLSASIPAIRFSRDESQILCFSASLFYEESSLRVVSAMDGSEVSSLSGHHNMIGCIAVNPVMDLVASCDNNGLVIVWDSCSWNIRWQQTIDKDNGVGKIEYFPDGSKLAAAAERSVSVWTSSTFEQLYVFAIDGGYVVSMSFNCAGNRIALGFQSSEYVRVFDVSGEVEGVEIMNFEAKRFAQVCYSRPLMVLM